MKWIFFHLQIIFLVSKYIPEDILEIRIGIKDEMEKQREECTGLNKPIKWIFEEYTINPIQIYTSILYPNGTLYIVDYLYIYLCNPMQIIGTIGIPVNVSNSMQIKVQFIEDIHFYYNLVREHFIKRIKKYRNDKFLVEITPNDVKDVEKIFRVQTNLTFIHCDDEDFEKMLSDTMIRVYQITTYEKRRTRWVEVKAVHDAIRYMKLFRIIKLEKMRKQDVFTPEIVEVLDKAPDDAYSIPYTREKYTVEPNVLNMLLRDDIIKIKIFAYEYGSYQLKFNLTFVENKSVYNIMKSLRAYRNYYVEQLSDSTLLHEARYNYMKETDSSCNKHSSDMNKIWYENGQITYFKTHLHMVITSPALTAFTLYGFDEAMNCITFTSHIIDGKLDYERLTPFMNSYYLASHMNSVKANEYGQHPNLMNPYFHSEEIDRAIERDFKNFNVNEKSDFTRCLAFTFATNTSINTDRYDSEVISFYVDFTYYREKNHFIRPFTKATIFTYPEYTNIGCVEVCAYWICYLAKRKQPIADHPIAKKIKDSYIKECETQIRVRYPGRSLRVFMNEKLEISSDEN